jgi:hypothetical protein
VAGTPVKTTSGYKNIEELVVGDEVLSQNVETGAIETNVVTDTHIRPISEIKTFYKLTIGAESSSEELFVTGEHPFWVTDRQEWVTVDDIEVGAKLTNHQGEELSIQGKALQSELQQTYNITVSGNNNYFAGKLETLVHNCGVFKTTKAATDAAKKLGFTKTNFYSHGQPVYKKGNNYITPDVDQHSGGAWKMANSVKNLGKKDTRSGTYDINLNKIGD